MERLYKQVKWLAIIAVFLSLYLTGLMGAISANTGNYTPWGVLFHCIKNGFSVWIFGLLLVISAGGIYYFYMKQKEDYENNDPLMRKIKLAEERQPYGESHFERPKEYNAVALVQRPENAQGIIFGQLDMSGKKLVNFRMDKNRLNQHMAVMGASGSGKTFTFTKPSCFQYVKRRESVIITDPDGGLYRDMAQYFMDNGYIVRRLDLKTLEKSDGWNCLRSIDGPNMDINAQLFANTVIANLTEDMTSIYAQGPMSILKALILKVMLSPDFPEEEKNIGTVYRLLQNPGGEAFLDALFDPDTLTMAERPCLGPYMSFKQGSPNLRGNLITNLSTQLQLLQGELVKKVLSTDGIDLELPGKERCAYFCLFPDNHDTYRFVVSLFFSMLFMRLVDYADAREDGKLPVPVNFLLDEFPSIGIIPDFDRKMATIRKRAMNVTMIFQDITQLQNNYRSTWVTLLSNCSTWYCLGINDLETAELIQKRIGDTTIQVKTEQHEALENYMSVRHRNSTGEGKRPLLNIDELMKMDSNQSIILFQGHNPILVYKFPFIDHPESKKLRKIDFNSIPSINDKEGRQRMYEEEEERRKEFYEEHPDIDEKAAASVSYEYDEEETYSDEGMYAYFVSELKRYGNNALAFLEPMFNRAVWKAKKTKNKYFRDVTEEDEDEPVEVYRKNDVDVTLQGGFKVDRDMEHAAASAVAADQANLTDLDWEELSFEEFVIEDDIDPEQDEASTKQSDQVQTDIQEEPVTGDEDQADEDEESAEVEDQDPEEREHEEKSEPEEKSKPQTVSDEPDDDIPIQPPVQKAEPNRNVQEAHVTKVVPEKDATPPVQTAEPKSESIPKTEEPPKSGIDRLEMNFKSASNHSKQSRTSMFPSPEDRKSAVSSFKLDDLPEKPPKPPAPKNLPTSNRNARQKGKAPILKS